MPDLWLVIPAGVLALLLLQLLAALWPKPVKKKRPALPGTGYALIYADKVDNPRKEGVIYSRLLNDPRYHLQGKPDLVYANGSRIIPVELKSGRIGSAAFPREGDKMQLAVYFFLIEAEFGQKPREGRLIYSDGMFVIRNTRALRAELLRILSVMQNMEETNARTADAAEPQYKKCLHCQCRGTVCEFTD